MEQEAHKIFRLLRWFCPPSLQEGIEGDLMESFESDVQSVGLKKAKRRLVWNTLRFFRPGILFRNKFKLYPNMPMFRNYFTIAIRSMAKQKLYASINAIGLSIGIAFCILIYLYIQDERNFDQFHTNKDRIFRIEAKSFDTWEAESDNPYNTHAWLQAGLKQALLDELPEVQLATRFSPDGNAIFRYGEKVFTESITYVDGDFFRMFSFPLLAGNPEKLFKSKSEIVITPEIAEKYFGKEDPIGKLVVLDIQGERPLTVTGIIASPPANSSLNFTVLVPQENRWWYERNVQNWGNYNTPTFVQLAPDADPEVFRTNLARVVDKYVGPKLEEWRKESVIPIPENARMLEYVFTNLNDVHLKKEIHWHKVSDPQYSWILGGIAVLILAIACINYISLALTTSASRRTEVGVRKVVGAQRNQLVYQFGIESILLAFISMIASIGLVMLFLPSFNEFTGKGIVLTLTDYLPLLGVGLLAAVLVGMVAGSYPAFYVSSFRPAVVLKGRFTSKFQTGFTRPLVVLQFAMSAFLIISSVIMYRQMRYITTKDLGYSKEQMVVIPTQTGWNAEADRTVTRYRARLAQEPSVVSVAGTTSSFSKGYSRYGYTIDGKQRSAYVYGIDPYYLPTLGMELVAGRNFDAGIPSDSNAVIINEALVRDMGWEDPLNEYLNWQEDSVGPGSQVIGVVKDYHFLSLESGIEPMFLSMNKRNVGYLVTMMVKLAPGDIPESMEALRKAWKEVSPNLPFDYSFLDEDVARQYEAYERWMNIMGLATGFAILISCLGLFGLAGVNAVNRTKEIGIRKVMGAELMNIFLLLNRQYIWLALIAFALAAPLSWYVMTQWLEDFEFSIEMGWELFAVSACLGLMIALVTVSYHAIKAALVNPAQTLKYE